MAHFTARRQRGGTKTRRRGPPGLQSAKRLRADIGGTLGLSFVLVCVNALLVEAARARRPRLQSLRAVVGAMVLVGVLALYGVVRNRALADTQVALADDRGGALRVAIIQGDAGREPVDIPATNGAAWRRYEKLTRQVGRNRADLVVWPESVLPVFLRQNPPLAKLLAALATETGQSLLVGALDNAGGDVALNSAYLIDPSPVGYDPPPASESGRSWALSSQVYHKVRLVPFGEYLPGAEWIPASQAWRTTGALLAGSEPRSFVLDHPIHARKRLILAPSICFEAIFPGWFNGLVRDGAALLANLTDDSWFGDSIAPAQHLEMTRLRAVETRRWLVRASNSGISAFIDPTGEIVASLPYGEVGTLMHTVAGSSRLTPYVRFGDWVVVVSVVIVIASVGLRVTNRSAAAGSPEDGNGDSPHTGLPA